MAKINELLKNNWVKAIAINLVIMIVILLLTDPVYETNDDYAISLRMVDGYPYITFINYYFCCAVIALQSVLHGINAFVITQMAGAFVSFTVITWIFFEKKMSRWFMILTVFVIALFAVDQYCIMQFTKSSALMLTAGLLALIDAFTKKRGIGFYIVAFVLIYVGFSLRFMNVFVAIGFAGVYLIAWIIINRKTLKEDGFLSGRRILIFAVCAVLLAGMGGLYKASDNANRSTEELKDYVEFDYYRQFVTDYPIYESYDSNEAKFAEIGLDKNDLYLMDNWYLDPDGAASTENLRAVYENVYKDSGMATHSVSKASKQFVRSAIHDIKKHNRTGIHMLLLLLLAMAGIIAYKPRYWLYIIAIGVLTVLVYVYLFYLGRPAYRAEYIADLSAAVWLLYFMDSKYLRSGAARSKGFASASAVCAVAISVMLLACQSPIHDKSVKMHEKALSGQTSPALAEYIKDHEDCFFVFGNGQRGRAVYYADPVSVPEPNFQQNALGFGSWGTKSPYLTEKLGKYGMNNTFGDLIDNDKAFVFENKKKDALTKYLNKWYSDENSEIVLEQVDVIDGHPLWRVRKY